MKTVAVTLFMALTLLGKDFILAPHNFSHINKVCQVAHGGDRIVLRGGIYKEVPRRIHCRGEKGSYLAITRYEDEKPIITKGIRLKGAWLKIEGLAFEGNSNALRYDEVIRHWWRPTKAMRNFGLHLQGHHILIQNNIFGHFPAYGLKIAGKSDYITIEHNIIYDNAWWSTGGTGGLVIKNIHQIDNRRAKKIHIVRNLFFGNESRIISRVFAKGFATMVIDEGESFLIQERDDAAKRGAKRGDYDGIYEVRGNLILFNGKGSSINKADNVELVANDLCCNGTTATSPQAAGIRVDKESRRIEVRDNAVQTCADGIAYSIKAKEVKLHNNYAKSEIKTPLPGVTYVQRLYRDPAHCDFSNPYFGQRANELLASFRPMLRRYAIIVTPTHYRVDVQKQIADILRYVPRTSATRIERFEDRIEIYNIDNRGIKGLGRDFILRLKRSKALQLR